jgi:hypothetical protein
MADGVEHRLLRGAEQELVDGSLGSKAFARGQTRHRLPGASAQGVQRQVCVAHDRRQGRRRGRLLASTFQMEMEQRLPQPGVRSALEL